MPTAAALSGLTVAHLKRLLETLSEEVPGKDKKPIRKDDLVARILGFLQDEKKLRAVWQRLDQVQQAALAETIWAEGARFNAGRFGAKYGTQPNWGSGDWWSSSYHPSLLNLFIYGGCEARYQAFREAA